jgi:putative transposase
MPEYVRWREQGATYFFTVVAYRRRKLFNADLGRRLLKSAMVEVRNRWPFDMPASVLLPDHLHCIWTLPLEDDDFPVRWANTKRMFTQPYLRSGGRELAVTGDLHRHWQRGVWQPRYWEHMIRNDSDFKRHLDYIHYNPVKHGYVEQAGQWPYSTFGRLVALGEYHPGWGQGEPELLRNWHVPKE